MSEFERIKQTVGDRTILLTSWFDDSKQTWRANAPDYAHLSALLATSRVDCESRKIAMERLCNILAGHFQTSKHR